MYKETAKSVEQLCKGSYFIDQEYGVNVPRPGCVKYIYELNATTTTCFCNTNMCNKKCVAKNCRIQAKRTMPSKNIKDSSIIPTYPIRVEHCRVDCNVDDETTETTMRTEKTNSEKTFTTSSTTSHDEDITDVRTTYVVSTERKPTSKSGSSSLIRNKNRIFSIFIVIIRFLHNKT